jgi:hypothetical protein
MAAFVPRSHLLQGQTLMNLLNNYKWIIPRWAAVTTA